MKEASSQGYYLFTNLVFDYLADGDIHRINRAFHFDETWHEDYYVALLRLCFSHRNHIPNYYRYLKDVEKELISRKIDADLELIGL